MFALPFTLVADLQWKMIPIVTIVAFTLMGVEGISDQIENPFGFDDTDLPLGQCQWTRFRIAQLTLFLDNFCAEIREEIECVPTC